MSLGQVLCRPLVYSIANHVSTELIFCSGELSTVLAPLFYSERKSFWYRIQIHSIHMYRIHRCPHTSCHKVYNSLLHNKRVVWLCRGTVGTPQVQSPQFNLKLRLLSIWSFTLTLIACVVFLQLLRCPFKDM